MTPLLIRARLQNGYVSRDPWSPAIDGILAAAFMRERLGDDFYTSRDADMRPVDGLPLEVVRHGERWWYAASSPAPIDDRGIEKRYYHRRFDDHHERYLPDGVGKVMTAAGPYKSTRLWEARHVCRGVEWHSVGDEGEVRRLLSTVTQIGGGRARGHGVVTEWIVESRGDADRARHYRPLPVEYAEARGIAGRVMLWGVAPPMRLPQHVCDCVMP